MQEDETKRLVKMKNKFKKVVQFITNPRLLICIFLAWLITNGWSYILLAVGTYFDNAWMIGISSAYLTFLWLPISPEKLVIFAIAIGLLCLIFPNDQKTLVVLREFYNKAKDKIKKQKKYKTADEPN